MLKDLREETYMENTGFQIPMAHKKNKRKKEEGGREEGRKESRDGGRGRSKEGKLLR